MPHSPLAFLVLAGALQSAVVASLGRFGPHKRALAQNAHTPLGVALHEELATRGYLLQALARGVGFRWAAVLTSLLFFAGHLANPGEGPIGLAAVLLIGLVLAYRVWRLGSLARPRHHRGGRARRARQRAQAPARGARGHTAGAVGALESSGATAARFAGAPEGPQILHEFARVSASSWLMQRLWRRAAALWQ